MKLSDNQFKEIIADKKRNIYISIENSITGLLYRSDMEAVVFQDDDVSDAFLNGIKETYDCSDFDDWDLIEWIRDMQHNIIERCAVSRSVSLEQYISDKYTSKAEFAKAQGVKPQQITQWISKDFIVIDDVMYSPRRELVSAD